MDLKPKNMNTGSFTMTCCSYTIAENKSLQQVRSSSNSQKWQKKKETEEAHAVRSLGLLENKAVPGPHGSTRKVTLHTLREGALLKEARPTLLP